MKLAAYSLLLAIFVTSTTCQLTNSSKSLGVGSFLGEVTQNFVGNPLYKLYELFQTWKYNVCKNGYINGVVCSGVVSAPSINFEYDPPNDPSTWSINFPKCGEGNQSPIKLDTCEINTALQDIYFVGITDMFKNIFELYNNYYTVQINKLGAASTIIGGPYPNEKFVLAQTHFHWGGPTDEFGSEHTIDDVEYKFEAHMVHYNSKYGDLKGSLGKDKGILVVAIMFQGVPNDNIDFTPLINQLYKVRLGDSKAAVTSNRIMDWLKPFTTQEVRDNGYFTYIGTLTNPPCTGGVTFVVMKTTGSIGLSQISEFRKLRGKKGSMTRTRRPFQPLNDRPVWCNK